MLPGYYPVSVTDGAVVDTELCPQSYICPGGPASAAFDPAGQPVVLTDTSVLTCPNGTWTQALGSSSENQCSKCLPQHHLSTAESLAVGVWQIRGLPTCDASPEHLITCQFHHEPTAQAVLLIQHKCCAIFIPSRHQICTRIFS